MKHRRRRGMNRKLRFASFAVAAVAGSAVVASLILAPHFASKIQEGVERYGTQMVGAPVTLERVELSPLTGSGRLIGLRVANPPGFRTDDALWLGEIEVAFHPRSIFGSPLLIRRIEINDPRITIEVGLGGSNLDAIGRNVAAWRPPPADDGPKSPAPGEAEGEAPVTAAAAGGEADGEALGTAEAAAAVPDDAPAPATAAESDEESGGMGPPPMIIRRVLINRGKVAISPKLLFGATLTAELPDIRLRDIGEAEGGATVGQVVNELVNAISIGVGDAASPQESDKEISTPANESS